MPNLAEIKLKDNSRQYRYQGPVTFHSALLFNLVTLSLSGWSALAFHPRVFHTPTNLKFLKLTMFGTFGACNIPLVQELNRSLGIHNGITVGTGAQGVGAIE